MTNQELRTQLWDYVYGLLEPAEAAALEVRIKSDPRLARLYAETRLESDLLAGAARLEQPPIPLTTRMSPAAATTQRLRALRPTRRSAWANGIAGLAAALLVGLFAYGWKPARPTAVITTFGETDGVRETQQEEFANPIIAEVRGPSNAREGLANVFVIETRDTQDAPKSVALNFQVQDANGRTDFESQVTTDASGRAELTVPGAAMRMNRKLLVAAQDPADDLPAITAPLEVTADDFKAHLETDREVSQPGETVFFRAVVLGENSRVESAPTEAEFLLLDPNGNPVPGSETKDQTVHGVAAGEAIIPSNAAEGQYEVLVRSPRQEFDEQRIPVQVQREGNTAFFAQSRRMNEVQARGVSPRLAANVRRSQEKLKQADGLSANAAAAPAESQSLGESKPQAAAAAPFGQAGADEKVDPNNAPASDKPVNDAPPPPSEVPAPAMLPAAPSPLIAAKGDAGKKEAAHDAPGRSSVDKKPAEVADGKSVTPSGGAFGGGLRGGTKEQGEGGPSDRYAKSRPNQLGDAQLALRDQSESFRESEALNPGALPQLIVDVEDLRQKFEPGQEVNLRLETKTEGGAHVSAVLGVRVVSDELTYYNAQPDFDADGAGAERSKRSLESNKDARQTFGMQSNGAQFNRASGPMPETAAADRPAELAANQNADALAKADGEISNTTAAKQLRMQKQATDFFDHHESQVTYGSNRELVAAEVAKFKSHTPKSAERSTTTPNAAPDVRPLGRRLLVGGLLGLIAIGAMFVMRVPVRAWAWAPTLVAASACLMLGIVRLAPTRTITMAELGGEKTRGEKTRLEKTGAEYPFRPMARPQTTAVPPLESPPGEDSLGLQQATTEALEGGKTSGSDRKRQMNREREEEEIAGQPSGEPEVATVEKAHKKLAEQAKSADAVAPQDAVKERKHNADAGPAVPHATLLWNPRLLTDETGAARIKFRLPEQPGRYRIQVQGHADGRLGAADFVIQTHAPAAAIAAPVDPAAPPPAADPPAAPAKPQPPVESPE